MEVIYTATATATGGREGHVSSSDGVVDFDMRPGGLKGHEEGKTTNPEQLFAAGYSACYAGAVTLAARLKKQRVGVVKVKMEVSLNKDDDGGFVISVKMYVTIPGVDDQMARELISDANNICPYSKATKGNVKTEITLEK